MEIVTSVVSWLTTPGNWQGPDGIPTRLYEHLTISGLSLLVALLVALPVGLLIGHTRRGVWLAVGLANGARAVPSYAVMALAFTITVQALPREGGLDFWPTVIAMVALAIPSILINTYVGVQEVDPELVEAAKGMGMTGSGVLLHVELPLALPAIFGGLRSAAVQVIATATLGAILSLGGLGRYVVDGNAQQNDGKLFSGVVLVAALALLADGLFALAQRLTVSPGVSGRGQAAAAAPAAGAEAA